MVAPDLRGAINGESDAPQDVQAYNLQKALVKDVAGDHTDNPLPSTRTELQRPERLFNRHRCSLAKQLPASVYDQPKHTCLDKAWYRKVSALVMLMMNADCRYHGCVGH